MTKRKTCVQCKRPISVCFCEQILNCSNHWPVTILQHYKENKHPLNTAIIAKLSLDNCDLVLSNDVDYQEKIAALLKLNPLMVYPDDPGLAIEDIQLDSPRPLIFLDGTWRKTRLLMHENPTLNQIDKVSIHPENLTRYRIRKSPNPQSLSTLEAIVHTLSILEQDEAKYQGLLNTLDWVINQQIKRMGREIYQQNYIDKKRAVLKQQK